MVGPAARQVAQRSDLACPEGSLHGGRQQAEAGSLAHLLAGPAQHCTAPVLSEAGQPLPGSRLGAQAGGGVLAKAAPSVPAHPGSHGDGQLGSGVLAEAGRGGFADPSSHIGIGMLAQGPLPGPAYPSSRSASHPATGMLAKADLPGPAHPSSGGSSQVGSGILSGPPDVDDMSDEMDLRMAAEMEQAELVFQAKLRLPAAGREGSSTQAPGGAGVQAGSGTQAPTGGTVLPGADPHAQASGAGPGGVLQAPTERSAGAAQCASRRGSPELSGAQAAAGTAGASSLQQEAMHAAAQQLQQQQQEQVQAGGPVAGILDDGFGANAFGDEEAFEAELAQLLAAADAPRGAGNPAAAGRWQPAVVSQACGAAHLLASAKPLQQPLHQQQSYLWASQTLQLLVQIPAGISTRVVHQVHRLLQQVSQPKALREDRDLSKKFKQRILGRQ